MKPTTILCIGGAFLFCASAPADAAKVAAAASPAGDACTANCPILRSEADASLGAEFDRLDLNHDGQLDAGEQAGISVASPAVSYTARPGAPIKGVIVKGGRNPPGTARLSFSPSLDGNGDGTITRAEWLADGLAQFDRADLDHGGGIDAAEVKTAGWDLGTLKK